ncbi:hypothetical protein DFH29DRAFT_815937, partial [Suillus ampliporus]
GELEHHCVKRFYARTNKNQFARGIAKHQQREWILCRLRDKHKQIQVAQNDPPVFPSNTTKQHPSLHFVDQEPLPYCSPESHYQISTSKKFHWDISAWLGRHTDDIAVQDFLPHLKEHVLGHLLGNQYEGDEMQFTPAQRNLIHIINNQIYRHKVLCINYTVAQKSVRMFMHF